MVNRCCMCGCNEESVDHLLIYCPIAHSLWVHMLQILRIQWVMPSSMESLMFCWSHWLRKFNSDKWNMIPGCLMWIVWTERNQHTFEATKKSLVQLQTLCLRTLFDWSRCWGSSNCSSIIGFLSSLRLVPWVFSFVAFCCFCLCSLSWTPCIFSLCFFLINITIITYQKKELLWIN